MDVDEEVALRRLTPKDESRFEEACRTFGTAGQIDPAQFLRRSETVAFLAEVDGRVAGWVWGHELIHPHGERTMILYSLDVVEQFRRRGLGKTLVTAFVENARAVDCTEVWVLTQDHNSAAVATYAAAGGERESVDQVMFTWPLSPRSGSSAS